MLSRKRQTKGRGGMFKIYDEPYMMCRSRHIASVFKICD